MYNLKKSITLEKLRRGEAVFCFKTNFTCARSVETMAQAGFDCIWICNEHVPTDYSQLEKMIMAAIGNGSDVMVRIPRGSYSDLIKPLELNASGILVPHVMSLQDAKDVVRMSRFYPVGRRPADGGNADAAFTFLPFKEYIKFANENRFVMIQIEDKEVVPDLEEICKLDGIDGIFFGPCDYSQSIGVPGETTHPEVLRVRKLVAETARKYGKFAATVGGLHNVSQLLDEGFRFINMGSDVCTVARDCSDIVSTLKKEGFSK